MAVLTLHHWTDRAHGLAECARVARQRVVLLTWDPLVDAFWLVREYLPAFAEADRRQFPEMAAYAEAFGPGARVALPDTEEGLERLRDDLASGVWIARHAHLLGIDELDLGYRLVIAELPA